MGDAARGEHEVAGPGSELLLADLEDVLALKHVEELVLVVVAVERRVDGLVFLEEREGPGRGPGGGLDNDLDLAELQVLAARRRCWRLSPVPERPRS